MGGGACRPPSEGKVLADGFKHPRPYPQSVLVYSIRRPPL